MATENKTPKVINISEDDFFEIYKPIINHIVRANTNSDIKDEDLTSFNGTMYETYGKEVEHIIMLANNPKTEKKIWTLIDGDEGGQYIVAGFHIVNRQAYFITQKSWVTGTEEVKLDTDF